MLTEAAVKTIFGAVAHEDTDPRRRSAHRPVHAAVEEVEHLRQVADEGSSPATPAIVAAAVLAFIVPLAATFMLVAFLIWHFA